jgi:hypothetical protein
LNSLLYVRRVAPIVIIASIGSVRVLSHIPPNRGNISTKRLGANSTPKIDHPRQEAALNDAWPAIVIAFSSHSAT